MDAPREVRASPGSIAVTGEKTYTTAHRTPVRARSPLVRPSCAPRAHSRMVWSQVIKEVEVEVIREVIKEVPVEVIREVEKIVYRDGPAPGTCARLLLASALTAARRLWETEDRPRPQQHRGVAEGRGGEGALRRSPRFINVHALVTLH